MGKGVFELNYFDLHCDTILRCYEERQSLYDNQEMNISLKRGVSGSSWVQAVAVWIRDEVRGAEAMEIFDGAYFRCAHIQTWNKPGGGIVAAHY